MDDQNPAQDQPKPKQPDYPNLNRGGFQKGVSGNPGGRPRNRSIRKSLYRLLGKPATALNRPDSSRMTVADFLAFQSVTFAGRGDSRHLRLIMEHTDGRPVIRIEQTKAGEESREAEVAPEVAAAAMEAIERALDGQQETHE